MKLVSKLLGTFLVLSVSLFSANVSAGWLSDLTTSSQPSIPYCQWSDSDDCTLDKWVELTKNVDGLITNVSASEYIQNITAYVLGFMAIIAVVYIIYAGFNILTWSWDEEKMKKSKSIIVYVVIGLFIMFLAYAIVGFIFKVLDNWDEDNTNSSTAHVIMYS